MKKYYDSEKKAVESESSNEAFIALMFNALPCNSVEENSVARLERLANDCEDPSNLAGWRFSIPLLEWSVGFLRDIETRANNEEEYADGVRERFIKTRVQQSINKLKHSMARCHPDLIVVHPSAEPYRPAGNVKFVAVAA
jgi:hypothetical protein